MVSGSVRDTGWAMKGWDEEEQDEGTEGVRECLSDTEGKGDEGNEGSRDGVGMEGTATLMGARRLLLDFYGIVPNLLVYP